MVETLRMSPETLGTLVSGGHTECDGYALVHMGQMSTYEEVR